MESTELDMFCMPKVASQVHMKNDRSKSETSIFTQRGDDETVCRTADAEEVPRLSSMVVSNTRVAQYAGDVADIAMNMNAQQVIGPD